MARKGENIFKRKDGRWEARYIKGYELSGKIRYGFCYGKTYKEAKDKVTQAKLDLLNRKPVINSQDRRRLSLFCEEWLAIHKGKIRESTYVKYHTMLEKHIKPKLGDYFLSALNTQLIEEFKWELLEETMLSPKTVKGIMVILRAVINYAAKQTSNPFPTPEFHYPKIGRKEARVLTVAEQQALTTYLLSNMDPCKFGVLLALQTGMRLGEICALQWKSISVPERSILICATMQRIKNTDPTAKVKTKLLIGDPKSDSSRRIIPMSDNVAGLCSKMKEHSPSAFILTGTQAPMEPRALQYRLGKYTRECGLEGIHFHTLRHSFATRCVEAGFELKSLSEILGHASTSITLDRYVHSSMELKIANMNKLTFSVV